MVSNLFFKSTGKGYPCNKNLSERSLSLPELGPKRKKHGTESGFEFMLAFG